MSEGARNSCIVANGVVHCDLWVLELLWDYCKCFHQFRYATYMIHQMCGIVPTYDADGNISPELVAVVKFVMAMGWLPATATSASAA